MNLTREQVEETLAKLSPREKRELDLAKRLLTALVKGNVHNLGGIFCHLPNVTAGFNSLRFSHTDMCDAVKCLQRLGYGIERVDAGGSPEWTLTHMPK